MRMPMCTLNAGIAISLCDFADLALVAFGAGRRVVIARRDAGLSVVQVYLNVGEGS